MTDQQKTVTQNERILSIDFVRGFTMFVLVSSFGQLFDQHSSNRLVSFLGQQLDHADWEGLRAWDLVQPVFMFIVGVSMPFSFSRKWSKGESWNSAFAGVLRRSALLLFLGWLIGSTETKSSYTNVLSQLAITYLATFLLMRKAIGWQLAVSAMFIVFTDLLYRNFNVAGFDQPFTADHNFGSWFDVWLTGGLSEDRWVAFNALPTTAHTIWGVITGTILMKSWRPQKKVLLLLTAGIFLIVAGYALGMYVPIIKRVCTSSFILASGGWSIVLVSVSYYLIDVLQYRRGVWFFAVVGMNPLFIYLFWHAGGKRCLQSLSDPVTYRVFGWMGPEAMNTVTVLTISAMLWYICYFLYRRKIFIKI